MVIYIIQSLFSLSRFIYENTTMTIQEQNTMFKHFECLTILGYLYKKL